MQFIVPILMKFSKWQGPTNNFFFWKMLLKKLLNIFSNFFFYLKVQSFWLIMKDKYIQMAASAMQ